MTFPLARVCRERGQQSHLDPTASPERRCCTRVLLCAGTHLEPGVLQSLLCIGSPVKQQSQVRPASCQPLTQLLHPNGARGHAPGGDGLRGTHSLSLTSTLMTKPLASRVSPWNILSSKATL